MIGQVKPNEADHACLSWPVAERAGPYLRLVRSIPAIASRPGDPEQRRTAIQRKQNRQRSQRQQSNGANRRATQTLIGRNYGASGLRALSIALSQDVNPELAMASKVWP